METAYLSVITFDNDARQIVPLSDLPSFQEPSIQATGVTALGSALQLVSDCIGREVHQGSVEMKGDWRPLVFLLTDGMPTDDLNRGLQAISSIKLAHLVACGAGSQVDTQTLKRIVETQGEKGSVIMLDTADSKTLSAFFKWVTDSIKTTSTKIDLHKKDDGQLPPLPPELNVVL